MQAGDFALTLEVLSNRQQFHDPLGIYEAEGVHPAAWPLFGVVWEAGVTLARHLATTCLNQGRYMELGCGLGLPSMVLKSREANIVATDYHSLAGDFLNNNTVRNQIAPIPFERLDWSKLSNDKHIDVMIGSDLLYEREQADQLAAFLNDQQTDKCLISDPGRGQLARFTKLMEGGGYESTSIERGRLIQYERS